MLKTVIEHYLIDVGLTAMFDNMVVNFTVAESFYETYKKFKNKDVLVLLTPTCVYDRNLDHDVVTGKLITISENSLKIELSRVSADALGWDGNIYLYNEDIYKLYA